MSAIFGAIPRGLVFCHCIDRLFKPDFTRSLLELQRVVRIVERVLHLAIAMGCFHRLIGLVVSSIIAPLSVVEWSDTNVGAK